MPKTKRSETTKLRKHGDRFEFKHQFRQGDLVKLVDIPSDLKEPDKPDNDLRTAELFRFCLGRQFRVHGFDRHGFCELQVSDSREVNRRFGKWHSIRVDPGLLELRKKTRPGLRRQGGLGWRIDFCKTETQFEYLKRNSMEKRR